MTPVSFTCLHPSDRGTVANRKKHRAPEPISEAALEAAMRSPLAREAGFRLAVAFGSSGVVTLGLRMRGLV